MAANHQCPNDAREQGISLLRDNGGPPTSLALMLACQPLGIHQAFSSDNNPKGNADTEHMMRTLKEACLWLTVWSRTSELI